MSPPSARAFWKRSNPIRSVNGTPTASAALLEYHLRSGASKASPGRPSAALRPPYHSPHSWLSRRASRAPATDAPASALLYHCCCRCHERREIRRIRHLCARSTNKPQRRRDDPGERQVRHRKRASSGAGYACCAGASARATGGGAQMGRLIPPPPGTACSTSVKSAREVAAPVRRCD